MTGRTVRCGYRDRVAVLGLLLAFVLGPLGAPAPGLLADGAGPPEVQWRESRAEGLPFDGRLVGGVQLPEWGEDFFTFDLANGGIVNPGFRRWGTDDTVRTLLRVVREHRAAHPGAPRVGIGDLSRRHGGRFGPRFGGLGHSSHQNGLDVDVLYPRLDRREDQPYRPGEVDRRLAQDLVDRFVAAGAEYVFVGPSLRLRGPRDVVQPLAHHDDHLHVRMR